MSALKGSLHPQAQLQYDAGRVPAATKLSGVTIYFNRSPQQEADLKALLAAQQDRNSPLYHKWLTPQQYADRFGMTQADLDSVEQWLQQQGFSIDTVANSRTFVRFSGTVGQVENAFETQIHYFNVQGGKHFAPATLLSVPTAMAPTVAAVTNLSDFRPQAQYVPRRAFTSSQTGNDFFAPGDIYVAYDMNPLITGGNNGTGQTIVVAGQSYINVSDIANFQNAAGLSVKAPNLILVPGSGDGTTTSAGDEGESDLDLEWSGAMAPGATIDFVYSGSNTNFTVFDAMTYAIDSQLGNIITVSYGVCEALLPSTAQTALETAFSQAAAQGQTIVAASGDQGSTSCFVSPTTTNPTLATQESLSVNYPASSQYVTGVGGTESPAADGVYNGTTGANASTYWEPETQGTDILTSLKAYIPEVAWNDEKFLSTQGSAGLSASGGGVSTLFSKPSWQTGVPGIPSDGKRDVPDVAFYSSPSFAGYLYCTSDTSDWVTASGTSPAQAASCNQGFRDGTSGGSYLTVAGGTSFATPIFAGMIADLNQKAGYTTGQGNINVKLYQLASNSTTYAAAFHDVTTGTNECLAGSTYCSSSSGSTSKYSAGTGYDLVTGLGSVDLNALATAWTASTSTAVGTTTTISASSTTPALNASDTFTVTVTAESGTSAPAGTVTIIVDNGTPVNNIALTGSGTSATATYQTSFTTAGGHSVVAQFVPTSATAFAASSGAITVTVPGTSSGKGSFTVGATNVTVSQGSSNSSTITVTPSGGYTGTVTLTPSSTVSFCYSNTSAIVTGTAAATATMTIDTTLADCGGGSIRGKGSILHRAGPPQKAGLTPNAPSMLAATFGLAGIFLAGLVGWRSRKMRFLASLVVLGIAAFTISACGGGYGGGGGGGGGGTTYTPKGTYTVTVTGQDASTSQTATGTFTLTVQ